MRVAIFWHSISGYMAACCALAAQMGDDLLVVTQRPDPKGATPFDTNLVKGVNVAFVDAARLAEPGHLADIVVAHRPDVVVLNGWFRASVALGADRRLAGVRKIMAIDRPRETWWKDGLNKVRHGAHLRRCDMVFVTGERCFQFARFLGFREEQIRRGTYGVDAEGFAPIYERRVARPGGWPRSFVFMGRYEPMKAPDVLVEAYRKYRGSVKDPWPLVCCGRGPMGELLRGVEGIEDRGFVQPREQPALLEAQGVFVMSSRFDPWPLVIVESCAAGLPVVCTNACGSAVELVRDMHNGVLAATEDAGTLGRAMAWMHGNYERLPEMGRRSREMSAAYSAQMWAARWGRAFGDVMGM